MAAKRHTMHKTTESLRRNRDADLRWLCRLTFCRGGKISPHVWRSADFPASGFGAVASKRSGDGQSAVSQNFCCPNGTIENSPAFQRWVGRRNVASPEGTPEIQSHTPSFSRPFGTCVPRSMFPGVKTPGYSQEVPPGQRNLVAAYSTKKSNPLRERCIQGPCRAIQFCKTVTTQTRRFRQTPDESLNQRRH
jgi:hypothetical protein